MSKAQGVIPNLVGIKFSSKDLVDMIGCVFKGKVNVLYGCDEVCYITCSVNTQYNYVDGATVRVRATCYIDMRGSSIFPRKWVPTHVIFKGFNLY